MNIKIKDDYKNLVPKLSKEDYDALVKSIVSEGLQNPITVNELGEILDGHTRYSICQKYNIPLKKEIRRFENKLDEKIYVVSTNLNRRHINKAQRTKLALEYLGLLQTKKQEEKASGVKFIEKPAQIEEYKSKDLVEHKPKDLISDIAKKFNVGSGTLKRAKVIHDKVKELPEAESLWNKIENGEATIGGVYKEIKKKELDILEPKQQNCYIDNNINNIIKDLQNNYFDSIFISLEDYNSNFFMLWFPIIAKKLKATGKMYIFLHLKDYKIFKEIEKVNLKLANILVYPCNIKADIDKSIYKYSYVSVLYFVGEQATDLYKYEKNIELKDLLANDERDSFIPSGIVEYFIKSGLKENSLNLSLFDKGFISYICGKFNIKSVSISQNVDNFNLRHIEAIDNLCSLA